MTRWKELPPKKQLLIGLIALAVLALGLTAFFNISHTVKKQNLKANADLILVLDGEEFYLPCRLKDSPYPFEPPPFNIHYIFWNEKSATTAKQPSLHFPEGGWDGEEAYELIGYNDTGKDLFLTDYVLRGLTAFVEPTHRKSDIQIRGGRLGADRGEEFLTRGIHLGDSVEDVLRILGEPDKPTENGQYAFYYFDTEEGGQYLLRLEYTDQKLLMIDLSYTFHS